MKKAIIFLALSLILLIGASLAYAGQQDKARVLLKFKDKADADIVKQAGGNVLHSYALLNDVLAVELPAGALKNVLKNPNVAGYELDVQVYALGKPNALGKPQQQQQPAQQLPWGVDRVDAELSAEKGAGVTVCVVDTGIDKTHPDLQENLAGGKNFVWMKGRIDPDSWNDDNGHGTHVAGTIAALDNSIGVVGVAPMASLLAAKVLNRQGSGYLSDVVAGIDYCVASGARIVSMSLGTSSDAQALHDAVDKAYNSGALLVAAAGNDYGGSVSYPAAYDSVVAVSATDSSDAIAGFSSLGVQVELAAPGAGILSTWKSGSYNTISGTSMAAPHVSGAAAIAMQKNPLFSNAEIRALLQATADDLGDAGRDILYGFGLVDAELV